MKGIFLALGLLAFGRTVRADELDWAKPVKVDFQASSKHESRIPGWVLIGPDYDCTAFERMRAPFIEQGVKAIRDHATYIRTKLIPDSDREIEELVSRISPEAAARIRKVVGKFTSRVAAGERKDQVRSSYIDSGKLSSVYGLLWGALFNGPYSAARTDGQRMYLYGQDGKYLGIEIDATLNAFFYSPDNHGLEPEIYIRKIVSIPLGGEPLPRIDVLTVYTIDLEGEGLWKVAKLAPKVTSDEEILNGTNFDFANLSNIGDNPGDLNRIHSFGFQGFKTMLDGIFPTVVFPEPPQAHQLFDKEGNYLNCTRMGPISAKQGS